MRGGFEQRGRGEEHVGSHVSLVLDRNYCSVSG